MYEIKTQLIGDLPKNPYRKGTGAYEGVVAHATAVWEDSDENQLRYFILLTMIRLQIVQTLDLKHGLQAQLQISALCMLNYAKQKILRNLKFRGNNILGYWLRFYLIKNLVLKTGLQL